MLLTLPSTIFIVVFSFLQIDNVSALAPTCRKFEDSKSIYFEIPMRVVVSKNLLNTHNLLKVLASQVSRITSVWECENGRSVEHDFVFAYPDAYQCFSRHIYACFLMLSPISKTLKYVHLSLTICMIDNIAFLNVSKQMPSLKHVSLLVQVKDRFVRDNVKNQAALAEFCSGFQHIDVCEMHIIVKLENESEADYLAGMIANLKVGSLKIDIDRYDQERFWDYDELIPRFIEIFSKNLHIFPRSVSFMMNGDDEKWKTNIDKVQRQLLSTRPRGFAYSTKMNILGTARIGFGVKQRQVTMIYSF